MEVNKKGRVESDVIETEIEAREPESIGRGRD